MAHQTAGEDLKLGVVGEMGAKPCQTLSKEATMSACTQIKADREVGRRNQAVEADTSTARIIGT